MMGKEGIVSGQVVNPGVDRAYLREWAGELWVLNQLKEFADLSI
jgi:hypothetical protein